MKKVAIIGAGPAGLTCAYELLRDNKDFIVNIYEKEDMVGGLSKTLTFEGNKVDIGGHRYFSKDSYVLEIWSNVMKNSGKEFKIVQRKSEILYQGRSFNYPIEMNFELLKNIGFNESCSMAFSCLRSFFIKKKPESLEDYYIKQFGKKLYSIFFQDYTKKVWGLEASKLSADWGEQRVQGISLSRMIKRSVSHMQNSERTLISKFMYPSDGAGSFWDSMANQIEKNGGNIFLQSNVISIKKCINQYEITFKTLDEKHKEKFDFVISTMPIKKFIEGFEGCPLGIKKIATDLQYRNIVIIAITIDKKLIKDNFLQHIDNSWIYVQEKSVKLGRIQILNNWSEKMVHNLDNLLIELEYFCDEEDEIWRISNKEVLNIGIGELKMLGFIEENFVLENWLVKKIPYAYPIYAGTYSQLEQVRNWINSKDGIYCIGRNGQHHYNNMDHSMQTGYKVAKYIKEELLEKGQIWNVNMDSEYHETY